MKFSFITDPIKEFRAIRLGKRALAAIQAGDFGAYEELNRRALAIMERSFGDIEQTAVYTTNLANVLDAKARWSEAVPFRQRSAAILEKTLGPNDPQVADALAKLATAYFELSKHEEAETLYTRALTIYKSQLGIDHPLVAATLSFLAVLLRKVGNAAEADRLAAQAEAILSNIRNFNHLSGSIPMPRPMGRIRPANDVRFGSGTDISRHGIGVHPCDWTVSG